MFEDLKQNNQGGSMPPVNMPTPPPANPAVTDMFADVDPTANQNNVLNKPSAVQTGKLKPVTNNAWAQAAPVNPTAMPEQMLVTEDHSGNRRLIVMLAVILLVLAVGAGAYFVFRGKISGLIPKNNNNNINTNVPVNTNVDLNNNQDNLNTTNNSNTSLDTQDSDSDGLTDAEENQAGTDIMSPDTDNDGLSDRDEVKLYKTDPLKADTDGDGLTDGEEVKVWNTDPLKADTDGDGYTDGQEVSNGYNPNGAGKLSSTSTVPGLINLNTNLNTNQNSNFNANTNTSISQ